MARFRTEPAEELRPLMVDLIRVLEFDYIDPDRVHLRRSWGSTSNAYARIWELPALWSEVLEVQPQYIIEVLSQYFDKLTPAEQTEILIHELLHIPKTFSGALRNHRGQGEPINHRTVNKYYRRWVKAKKEETAASEAVEAAKRIEREIVSPPMKEPKTPAPSSSPSKARRKSEAVSPPQISFPW
ncbi:MAG: hypothetical protein HKN21_14520 [Candidatus Eisenbacteria bacterium]|uniref:Putative phage metallopeptidase domain-containing protein n=1 Tax=Eiseniibacteriota bacterium TaxID=2212470 RepID=A0A7Y2EDS0_UNCEI|nr:hypothetical protein [Candidatus Eisenbacteria bacterium]